MFYPNPMPGQPGPMPGQLAPIPISGQPASLPGQFPPMPAAATPSTVAGPGTPNLALLLALLQKVGAAAMPANQTAARGQPPGAPRGVVQAPPPAAAASGTAPSPVLAAAQGEDQLSQLLKLLKSFLPPQALASGLDAGGASAPIGARRGMRQP